MTISHPYRAMSSCLLSCLTQSC